MVNFTLAEEIIITSCLLFAMNESAESKSNITEALCEVLACTRDDLLEWTKSEKVNPI